MSNMSLGTYIFYSVLKYEMVEIPKRRTKQTSKKNKEKQPEIKYCTMKAGTCT